MVVVPDIPKLQLPMAKADAEVMEEGMEEQVVAREEPALSSRMN